MSSRASAFIYRVSGQQGLCETLFIIILGVFFFFETGSFYIDKGGFQVTETCLHLFLEQELKGVRTTW